MFREGKWTAGQLLRLLGPPAKEADGKWIYTLGNLQNQYFGEGGTFELLFTDELLLESNIYYLRQGVFNDYKHIVDGYGVQDSSVSGI
jgi:hypothetical protein